MDLTAQEDQGEFNSCPLITQLGAGSKAGSSKTDYPSAYCRDKVLNPYRVGLDLPALVESTNIEGFGICISPLL